MSYFHTVNDSDISWHDVRAHLVPEPTIAVQPAGYYWPILFYRLNLLIIIQFRYCGTFLVFYGKNKKKAQWHNDNGWWRKVSIKSAIKIKQGLSFRNWLKSVKMCVLCIPFHYSFPVRLSVVHVCVGKETRHQKAVFTFIYWRRMIVTFKLNVICAHTSTICYPKQSDCPCLNAGLDGIFHFQALILVSLPRSVNVGENTDTGGDMRQTRTHTSRGYDRDFPNKCVVSVCT